MNSNRIKVAGNSVMTLRNVLIIQIIFAIIFALLRENPQLFLSDTYPTLMTVDEILNIKPDKLKDYYSVINIVMAITEIIFFIVIFQSLSNIANNLINVDSPLDLQPEDSQPVDSRFDCTVCQGTGRLLSKNEKNKDEVERCPTCKGVGKTSW
ncbi:MAG: hypothetical protein JWN78_3104 [Bacteroidota bacterium]|nr:hypothetical protein [Bacteroidota bacterium]